jgi:ABC-2 type transport system ATP-binding protein
MTDDAAVRAVGLAKSYGDQPVLDGVDLEANGGSVFALLGPNGAGKTTTVRILSTLLKPDAGMVTVGGFDVLRSPTQVRRLISLTSQDTAIDELLTTSQVRRLARLCRQSSAAPSNRLCMPYTS